jgi:hypothetical protein
VKPLDDSEHQLAEAAARVIAKAEEVGLPDAPDACGVTPRTLGFLARAYVELRGQICALHDLIDQADPDDPIRTALAKVGLEKRPRDWAATEPRLVRQVEALSASELLALYCRTMRETEGVFVKYESYVVRVWDGMDGCWTNCTGEVGREEALRYWAEQTGGGTHHVAYSEIDYYRIFPGGTKMLWDGSEGREMHR